jgi:hypothetical protein
MAAAFLSPYLAQTDAGVAFLCWDIDAAWGVETDAEAAPHDGKMDRKAFASDLNTLTKITKMLHS